MKHTKMVCFLLLLMVTACAATSIKCNLENRCMYFPKATDTDYAKLSSSICTYKAVTVCLRFKTNLCRDHTLFSAATYAQDNAFLLYWSEANKEFQVYVQGTHVHFNGLDYDRNEEHLLCVTWDSETGLVQMWFDGKYLVPKHISAAPIHKPNIILGQDQDLYNGGFDIQQSFVGEICNLHVWDYVVKPCEIKHYMKHEYFLPGNAINWNDLEYTLVGSVFLECKKKCPDCHDEHPHDHDCGCLLNCDC